MTHKDNEETVHIYEIHSKGRKILSFISSNDIITSNKNTTSSTGKAFSHFLI